MVGEAIAGLSAFKTMFDIAKSIKDMNDAVNRNAAVADLGEQIIAAQTRYATAIEQVDELKKELARFETWEAEKQRYELKDLYCGFFAYIPKEGEQRGEPPHAICANCYQRGVKSILQSSGHTVVHERSWDCPACKMKIKNQWNNMTELIQKCRQAKHVEVEWARPQTVPGETCPKCGELEFRIEKSEKHPQLGLVGGRIHFMKCTSCEFTEERIV